ncbi:hypothetical protein FFWV33_17300 [Flavobacterium faecale]|uniref:Lipoprotein n=1 Tax=Flavobacterium faecale TaxID=1355330 RepID=A0A2S1LHG0_9FLAO|nr:DUF6146 family protein [Flavobacterium faecale]AWG23159.1 hypothetical protein FFWV33_17300 [Flavobacterium faecale]
MKKGLVLFAIILFLQYSCTGTKSAVVNNNTTGQVLNDTVKIVNDSLQYEVIIIDNGYSTWLASRALPRNYHSQQFLELKNQLYVNEWNNRVLQPQRYSPSLYELTINYDPSINYGYEVNYLIYNYMIFFQNTYKQKLYGYVPLR